MHCPTCRAPVRFRRWDAFDLVLDNQELGPLDEAACFVLGVRTFHLVEPNLFRRHKFAIVRQPDPSYGLILREHHCDSKIPITGKRRVFEDESAEPPF